MATAAGSGLSSKPDGQSGFYSSNNDTPTFNPNSKSISKDSLSSSLSLNLPKILQKGPPTGSASLSLPYPVLHLRPLVPHFWRPAPVFHRSTARVVGLRPAILSSGCVVDLPFRPLEPAAGASEVRRRPDPSSTTSCQRAGSAAGHQWALPFAARSVAVASSRRQQQQAQPLPTERKGGSGFMDAGSGSSAGPGFDEEGLTARREVSSSLKELTVRVEAKGGSCSGSAGTDQLPNTPRSKHSATKQRRRSKINDRCVPPAPTVRAETCRCAVSSMVLTVEVSSVNVSVSILP